MAQVQGSYQRVGGIRCYWGLVTPQYSDPNTDKQFDLVFVHVDPVCSAHLARQRLSLIGPGVMEFIHPGERERESGAVVGHSTGIGAIAGGHVLIPRGPTGRQPGHRYRRHPRQCHSVSTVSVCRKDTQTHYSARAHTRVRFSRLTWIRRILGGTSDEIQPIHDAEKFALNDQYLILDLVVNWVSWACRRSEARTLPDDRSPMDYCSSSSTARRTKIQWQTMIQCDVTRNGQTSAVPSGLEKLYVSDTVSTMTKLTTRK